MASDIDRRSIAKEAQVGRWRKEEEKVKEGKDKVSSYHHHQERIIKIAFDTIR
jgi:hypothetical protein